MNNEGVVVLSTNERKRQSSAFLRKEKSQTYHSVNLYSDAYRNPASSVFSMVETKTAPPNFRGLRSFNKLFKNLSITSLERHLYMYIYLYNITHFKVLNTNLCIRRDTFKCVIL